VFFCTNGQINIRLSEIVVVLRFQNCLDLFSFMSHKKFCWDCLRLFRHTPCENIYSCCKLSLKGSNEFFNITFK